MFSVGTLPSRNAQPAGCLRLAKPQQSGPRGCATGLTQRGGPAPCLAEAHAGPSAGEVLDCLELHYSAATAQALDQLCNVAAGCHVQWGCGRQGQLVRGRLPNSNDCGGGGRRLQAGHRPLVSYLAVSRAARAARVARVSNSCSRHKARWRRILACRVRPAEQLGHERIQALTADSFRAAHQNANPLGNYTVVLVPPRCLLSFCS